MLFSRLLQGSHQKDYTPGGRDAFTPSKTQVVDYLKPLRFTYHRTAFDIDLDNLDKQPWKDPHVDTSLYFNYGFNETTWQVCMYSVYICLQFIL